MSGTPPNQNSEVAPNTTDAGATAEQLYRELVQDEATEADTGVRLAPEQHAEVILDRVVAAAFDEQNFSFEEATVKENLDEILLLLIAHRSSGKHGKGLMGDLAAVFDTRLSPGTVYPRLHELEERGLLDVQELVRTKEYQIRDEEALAARVESAMAQHLALGLFFRTALADLS
jgi:hypothetical protein